MDCSVKSHSEVEQLFVGCFQGNFRHFLGWNLNYRQLQWLPRLQGRYLAQDLLVHPHLRLLRYLLLGYFLQRPVARLHHFQDDLVVLPLLRLLGCFPQQRQRFPV